jgi:ankyrin repeat-rich membrane spanning protein
VEILLRNPKNSQLLYRPNAKGETPYNMDAQHEKTILGQLFGARRLNMEQNENLLGYDLYSGALAEMLSEPSVSMPISVGLYAKWGSGKSFLLTKLKGTFRLRLNGKSYKIVFTVQLQALSNHRQ